MLSRFVIGFTLSLAGGRRRKIGITVRYRNRSPLVSPRVCNLTSRLWWKPERCIRNMWIKTQHRWPRDLGISSIRLMKAADYWHTYRVIYSRTLRAQLKAVFVSPSFVMDWIVRVSRGEFKLCWGKTHLDLLQYLWTGQLLIAINTTYSRMRWTDSFGSSISLD
jgi:hypothetical protein